jgi:hypothetical protein
MEIYADLANVIQQNEQRKMPQPDKAKGVNLGDWICNGDSAFKVHTGRTDRHV